MTKIEFPALDMAVPSAHPSQDTLNLLANRRSSTAKMLGAPGPDPEQLSSIIRLGSRVPDHRKVVPFRFLRFTEESREAFADVLVDAAAKRDDEAGKLAPDTVRGLVHRAPSILVLICSPNEAHKTPVWEQQLTCGAVGYGLLLAASAMGFAAQWLSEWMAYDDHVTSALGLDDHEKIVGIFYFGTASADPKERARPDHSAIVSTWSPKI